VCAFYTFTVDGIPMHSVVNRNLTIQNQYWYQ
jgi:hypothetical protein